MNTNRQTTYDVQIFSTEIRDGARGRSYRVRWKVAGQKRGKTFATEALADSFRSELVTAARQGSAFTMVDGLPTKMAQELTDSSWYSHARDFARMKWDSLAPRSRRSVAESLTTLTLALLTDKPGRPREEHLRSALMNFSFVKGETEPTDPEVLRALQWLEKGTVRLQELQESAHLRACLNALSINIDGAPAAASTIARKRGILFGALKYAVELGKFQGNPLERISWRAPKKDESVDVRSVVNPDQARALLAAMDKVDPAMTAFFACIYFAALRPSEAVHLKEENCTLPARGWGELMLTGSTQRSEERWGSAKNGYEDRELKHRSTKTIRRVPASPELVKILRHHLAVYGTGPEDRLFCVRTRGTRVPVAGASPVSREVYSAKWRKARAKALTKQQFASPLAKTPYTLRHACVSTWLSAGVAPQQVAAWAGHSVAVLLRVYAHVVEGQVRASLAKIEAALRSKQNGNDS